MTELDSQKPTQDERLMAALSHVTTLMPFMGVIAPIIIWITQKDKSQYVAFQALQALIYQLGLIVAWFIGMGCYMCSFFGMFLTIPFMEESAETAQKVSPIFGLTFGFPFLVLGAVFIGWFIYTAYGIFGAIMVLQGKPFHYLIIGGRVESFLQEK